jgi:hypothetical protein
MARLAMLAFLVVPVVYADPLACDLNAYKAQPGLNAAV